MAAVILPFALSSGPRPAQEAVPPARGAMTLDLDGTVSPLRGPLPAANGRFGHEPAPARRVPAEAILAIGRRIRRTAPTPAPAPAVAAARSGMPRKHKLMLLTAAAILYTGSMEARRHFKPRAVLIEVPSTRAHAIAALPLRMPAA
ncbi:hypothetical protein NS228_26860 [Methylobacterium indicum]|uniref:hypothetical protein n=1 Tax=Methylobacterium indicum TaxID=1775910 RepID=UPI00073484B9|nr:hypothetical protein [Methylobacterium indicum]KTS16242.1 hypothetical protein NS229_27325 [Methylobacterium indicum]KTS24493.1 hypothetical protein NS228_26860 [Methylobacterium indicum]